MMTDEGSVTIPLIDCELGLLGQGNVLLAECYKKQMQKSRDVTVRYTLIELNHVNQLTWSSEVNILGIILKRKS